MPEFDVFLDKEEQLAIAAFFISEGAVLVPDSDYDTPEYQRIDSVSIFEQVRSAGVSMFFVLLDSITKSPLEMRYSNTKEKYFIMPRNGGPSIEFSCGTLFIKETHQHISQSFIAHYPSYWNTLTEINEQVPEELKQFYKKVISFVKARCHKIKTKKRTYWVGMEAESLRNKGGMLVGVDV